MSKVIPLHPQGEPVRPWYEHRWPWFLMLGPFLVLLAGSYSGWLAFSHQDTLVVGDYYKQGKAINQDLRRDRVASTLGLDASLRYDPGQGVLNGRLVSHGKPLATGLQLHLAHATQPEKDIKLVLQSDADGRFSAPLPMFERTRWQVQLENTQREWRLGGIWIWPGQPAIAMRADIEL